jgi:hypothetical protein
MTDPNELASSMSLREYAELEILKAIVSNSEWSHGVSKFELVQRAKNLVREWLDVRTEE